MNVTEVRFWREMPLSKSAAKAVAALLPSPMLCSAQQLTPAGALDGYLARTGGPQMACPDSVFARFLANDTNPAGRTGDVVASRQDFSFAYNKTADYNGLTAYVFLLKPRRKRAGLFRGELWLTADTAAPLRLWGDLVKSPSIVIRSFRFVQDYQTVAECSQPLRLVVTTPTRIAGTVEMVVWQYPAVDKPESIRAGESSSQFQHGGQTPR